jgi:hypothetical protein
MITALHYCVVTALLIAIVPAVAMAQAPARPHARVRGLPGAMAIQTRECPVSARPDPQRIVDLAMQEWVFFGSRIAEPRDDGDDDLPEEQRRQRRPRLSPEEAARVAPAIAGYWAVTPQGSWIVGRQNERWNGPDGIGARWNAPWSAAFISWVMCEAGLGTSGQFVRAIAHHAYIDQAIRARDGSATQAEFTAHEIGEVAVRPGDLLCAARRPVYRSIADRRRQMGTGARSHCDIVVRVDPVARQVHAIGGNVRGVVSLKRLPATLNSRGVLQPTTGDNDRPLFVHMQLRAMTSERATS